MEIIEGSHHDFHPDGWEQIESIKNVSQTPNNTEHSNDGVFDFGASLDAGIAEARDAANNFEAKSEDALYARATQHYLTTLQQSYRELQVTAPHLSADLLKDIGEARACRELCSVAAQGDSLDRIDTMAIELAVTNINWNAIPIEEVNATFDSIAGTFKASEDKIAKQEPRWQKVSNSPAQTLLGTIPTHRMQELFLYTQEDGSPSAFARYIDADSVSESQLVQKAKFFMLTTDPENGLETMQGNPVIDRLITKLGGPEAARIVYGESEIVMLPTFTSPENAPLNLEAVDAHNAQHERAIQDYLLRDVALSTSLISSISDAIKSRLRIAVNSPSPDTDSTDTAQALTSEMVYDAKAVTASMLRIGENVRTLGAENIERLHTELGVTNLDRYNPEDLETLVKLLDNDPATIENLKNGDVMAIMSDTYGDWNGAFNESLDHVRRDSGRALLFEVSKPSDFYRHMILLKQRGIKPSSLSINAHGLPGLTQFGGSDISKGFYLAAGWIDQSTEESKKSLNVSLYEASLPRLFSDEFFQPSRGIDDAADWIGSTQIIINSCSSDVANEDWTYSTAETIATRAAKTPDSETRFSVIGASDVLYVENSPTGLRFMDKDGKGIGVKIDAKIVPPARQNKILSALKRQKTENQLLITRSSYAVIPTSNTLRKVA